MAQHVGDGRCGRGTLCEDAGRVVRYEVGASASADRHLATRRRKDLAIDRRRRVPEPPPDVTQRVLRYQPTGELQLLLQAVRRHLLPLQPDDASPRPRIAESCQASPQQRAASRSPHNRTPDPPSRSGPRLRPSESPPRRRWHEFQWTGAACAAIRHRAQPHDLHGDRLGGTRLDDPRWSHRDRRR